MARACEASPTSDTRSPTVHQFYVANSQLIQTPVARQIEPGSNFCASLQLDMITEILIPLIQSRPTKKHKSSSHIPVIITLPGFAAGILRLTWGHIEPYDHLRSDAII